MKLAPFNAPCPICNKARGRFTNHKKCEPYLRALTAQKPVTQPAKKLHNHNTKNFTWG